MIVPWYGKEWPISEELQEQVRKHVRELPADKREDYIKFLTGHCKYKMTFGEPS